MGVAPEPIPDFDLYGELEVVPTASTATIDAAWRSLVKRHHPDATGPSDAGIDVARIRRLNIAHHWLVDGERRARYDHERALGGRGPLRRAGQSSSAPPPPEPEPEPQQRSASPGAGPRAGPGAEARDWAQVRHDARRASRRSRMPRPRPLLGSPILSLALGIVAFAVILGLVLVGPRLVGVVLPAATPAPSAAESLRTPAVSPTPAPTPDVETALAATLPDRVAGIELSGETATGAEVFGGDTASLDALLAQTGGSAANLVAAYKAGETTGGDVLSIVALQIHSVDGLSLADAFRAVTAEDPEAGASWSDVTMAGRSVAVSPDGSDPRFSAYLVTSAEAMYLVLSSDPDIAEAAIRSLP